MIASFVLPRKAFLAPETVLSRLKAQRPDVKEVPKGTVFSQNVSDLQEKDKFRVQYLAKLSDGKVWIPEQDRPPQHQSVIIFDWDDTLMYTSFLQMRGFDLRNISPSTRAHLQGLESAAYSILDMALGLGQTFIITNAEKGWVEACVERYMPSLRPILDKVPVISARTAHEAESCGDVYMWKRLAFLELGRQLDSETITNIVSIGDSIFELEAAQALGTSFTRKFVKTVKLQEKPSPEELSKQLSLLAPKFCTLVQKASNLRVQLTKKPS